MKLKLTPIQQVALALFFVTIGTFFIAPVPKILLHLAATIGLALVLFLLFTVLSKKQKNLWNTIISALIIFLVLHYGLENKDIIYPLIATFLTIFSKFFLEYKGSPIINPVVFCLFGTYLLTHIFPGLSGFIVSWWGTK
ncbi:hypothetical protein HY605_02740, partial [Candidatus Peregrinibacteria bacterium]|nr:hypothetical protein [Candidatus Peregrinibacteria bacterium]